MNEVGRTARRLLVACSGRGPISSPGPELISNDDVAAVLSKLLGRTITYRHLSFNEDRDAMTTSPYFLGRHREGPSNDMTDLKGKTALITGATSGIGRATALALAARGAHVLVTGRNEQRATDLTAEIEKAGGSAAYHVTALSDVASVRELAQWAVAAGDSHVDILVNNAGVALGGPSDSATEAEFDETFTVNVKVPFFLVADLAPAMAERGWGAIVSTSTMVASFGMPGLAMYGASRAAIELLTKAWAAEYGPHGVRVNAIAPGPTRTPASDALGDMPQQLAALAPAGRIAEPEEMAAAIAYLASDDASFIHGVTIPVDGGRVAT